MIVQLAGVRADELRDVTMMLPAGVHGFVGGRRDGAEALCEVLSGRRRPRAGRVAVLGKDPSASPNLRRRIGALLAEADLVAAPTVGQMLARIGKLRGCDLSAALEALALQHLAPRPVVSLHAHEARAVELAIALAIERPALVVLNEPFSSIASFDRHAFVSRITTLARQGTCVILAASATSDIEPSADAVHHLVEGRVARSVDAAHGLAARSALVVRLAAGQDATPIAGALGARPAIAGVAWHRNSDGTTTLRVTAPDIDEAAIALSEAATEHHTAVAGWHTDAT